ncbi:F-box protein [Phanerochaete sordida]|uniref:F-box protein n=1 Tax=Phanerochaete sordida TaxID=48140 RepID=A0A9P3LAW7_9APHY|nr:F-box protein [Phanerochaete sordida]
MSYATAADLPVELLCHIVQSLRTLGISGRRRSVSTHDFLAASLVCKYWSETLRVVLFRRLKLRDDYDVQFLKDLVCSPRFASSSLARPGAIKSVDLQCRADAAHTPDWIHHVYSLTVRLPTTHFKCTVRADPATSGRWNPFTATPIAPSYLRLSSLSLTGVHFASTVELGRLLACFPSMASCNCDQLTFREPHQPVVLANRALPEPRMRCLRYRISRSRGIGPTAQALLASQLAMVPARTGLDDRMWTSVLFALCDLVGPMGCEQITVDVFIGHDEPGKSDAVHVGFSPDAQPDRHATEDHAVFVAWLAAGHTRDADTTSEPSGSHIRNCSLSPLLIDLATTTLRSVDTLHVAIGISQTSLLHVLAREENDEDHRAMKEVLSSILRHGEPAGVLAAQMLVLTCACEGSKITVTTHDILSMPWAFTVDGATVFLDPGEQAEWLMRDSCRGSRDEYLRDLAAERARKTLQYGSPSAGNPRQPGEWKRKIRRVFGSFRRDSRDPR